MVGELALDGSVRPVAGALAIAEAARALGARAIVVPAENGPEAALVAGIDVIPLDGLAQLPAVAAASGLPERPAPLPLVAEPGRQAPTSPTCAASAISGTRSRSRRPAATAC